MSSILWLVGVLGITGVIYLALVLSGSAIAVTLAGVVKGALAFFRTPVGQLVGLALIVVAFALMYGSHVRKVERARAELRIIRLNADWQEREERAAAAYELARQQRDAEIATEINRSTETRIAEIETHRLALQKEVDAYAAERAKAPDPVCRISPADAARLLGLGRPTH